MSSSKLLSTLMTPAPPFLLTDMNNIQDFFTEDEWDAIYNAMADYQDHGEDETDLAYSIQTKITALFN